MSARLDTARSILRSTFGFESFRHGQEEIIQAVLSGRDVLGVMPTGGGKSLCYQVPALSLPHCTLVVSPLVALMTDQVGRLKALGVAAAALHAGLTHGDVNAIMFEAHAGRLKLLYVAPERLESATFRSLLSTIPLSLVAVDEAHCISEWGHDFRPAYRSIPRLFDDRPRVPVIALTATATPDVRRDIADALALRDPVEIVRGFDRSNLAFRVEVTPHKIEAIAREALAHPDQCVLVYAGSRRRVDDIASELAKRKIAAAAYHAGKTPAERTDVQDRFLRGQLTVLVATNAFGMGIDKADVRHVIHADLTLTLEAYYQEAGRAGRDGRPATCTLLYQTQDRRLMDFFITSTYPERGTILAVLNALYDRAGVGVGGSTTEAVHADAASLAADLHLPVGHVSGVLSLLQRSGVILSTGAQGRATLRMRSSTERLREFVDHAPAERARAVEVLGRLLSGSSFDHPVSFDVNAVLRRSGITLAEFSDAVRSLHLARILQYTPPEGGGGIVLLRPRPPRGVIPVDMADLARRRDHALSKLDRMIQYAESPQCKRNLILNYFGDADVRGTCGRCSSCTGSHRVKGAGVDADLLVHVVRAVHELGGSYGRNVVADLLTGTITPRIVDLGLSQAEAWGAASAKDRAEVIHAIDAAIHRGLIVRSSGEYPTIALTAAGRDLGMPLPRQRRFRKTHLAEEADPSVATALMAWRERTAHAMHQQAQTLLSNDAVAALATDAPQREADLQPGRHGSGLMLAQYGAEIIGVIAGVRRSRVDAIPKVRLDNDVMQVLKAVRPGRSVMDVARALRITPAAAARNLQRALEAGADLQRGELVPDDLFAEVMDYLRDHRYAKLRQIRETVGADVDMPTLRVAMAFARRELYGVA